MQKHRLREYSYTIVLGISVGVAAIFWQFGGLKEYKPGEISYFLEDATGNFWGRIMPEKSVEAVSVEMDIAEASEESSITVMEADDADTIEESMMNTAEESSVNIAAGDSGMVLEEEAPLEFYHADVSYFDDAFFIGDSRTVGLYEYGGLGNAEVFANSGMNIYKVFHEEFELRSGEKVTLEEALQTRQFGKIYIMLGINELGYDFEQTVERYEQAIAAIRKLQPDALIFIQANLHITKVKAEESELFNNVNIDRFNKAVSELADGKKVFYLDVNPLFDDENGCLSEEFTTDHAHILGKYYVDWVDFILQNAVR